MLAGCTRAAAPLPPAPASTAAPTPPPPVTFPRDAGPHDVLTEWWYYTGHLNTPDGRLYGFEFTIFQVRRQDAPTGYIGHFAVSDIGAQRFSHQARFVQGDPQPMPLDVQGWRVSSDAGVDTIEADMSQAPGVDPPFHIRLRLADEKPPALHHGGFIDYGPAGGSYYYSRTRLGVAGELGVVGAAPTPVAGLAWMDHQWGNFVVVGPSLGGWDWYSLQLDDRSELMLYVLRGQGGQTSASFGSLVQPDGQVHELEPGEVRAEATGEWTSPHTGGVYPSGWRLTLADGRALSLQPQLTDQELYFPEAAQAGATGVPAYWEGAVTVSGAATGVAYVELTGYAR